MGSWVGAFAVAVAVGGVVCGGGTAFAGPAGPAGNRLVDLASAAVAAAGAAEGPTVSADGRFVVYSSAAGDLRGAEGPGGIAQIYRTDLASGTTVLVSQLGGVPGDARSHDPQISDDGQTVAYLSEAGNLATGAAGDLPQLYTWSAASGSSTLTSVAGGLPFSEGVDDFELAGDGLSSAVSTLTGVLPGVSTNGVHQVYLLGVGAAARLVSDAGTSGTAGFASDVIDPALSRDGRFVVFVSRGPGSATGPFQVYLRDTVTRTTTLVTMSSLGRPGDRDSVSPAISGDGATIAYVGDSTNLATRGEGRAGGVFIRDLRTGRTVQTDVTPSGFWQRSAAPSVSDDGRIVVFEAEFIDAHGVPTGPSQVYSVDVTTRAVTPLSQSRILDPGNGPSTRASVSAEGHSVVYQTAATNLTPHRYPASAGSHVLVATIG